MSWFQQVLADQARPLIGWLGLRLSSMVTLASILPSLLFFKPVCKISLNYPLPKHPLFSGLSSLSFKSVYLLPALTLASRRCRDHMLLSDFLWTLNTILSSAKMRMRVMMPFFVYCFLADWLAAPWVRLESNATFKYLQLQLQVVQLGLPNTVLHIWWQL